jgi:thioredoxin 1
VEKCFEVAAGRVRFKAMILLSHVKSLLIAGAAAGLVITAGCGNPSAMNESSPNVKHITQGEFADEVTRCPQPVVVEFYATWCGPCRELGPLLDRVAGGYTGKIKFVKVNVDESPGLAQNYQVQAIPLVLMFKDDKLADRVVGLPTETDLKTKLDALAAAK